MKESIHRYFLIGTLTWMSFPKDTQAEVIRKLACDDYFDVVEVCRSPDAESAAVCKRLLEQSHMQVCYGAHPSLLGARLNPNDLDEAGRERAEAVLLSALDEAEELGAGAVAFLAGKYQEETKEQAYRQLLRTTRAVCDRAAEKGMRVELEMFDYNVDKAALIGPAPLAARFAADMRTTHHNFGLLADLSHFPITFESARFVVQTLRPYITHLHFGNAVVRPGCMAYGDKHPRLGLPCGANDTPELLDYLRVLKEEGFFRPNDPLVLSIEVAPMEGEDADIVLANTKRVLNRAWALLDD